MDIHIYIYIYDRSMRNTLCHSEVPGEIKGREVVLDPQVKGSR